jgi:hypothetical protein
MEKWVETPRPGRQPFMRRGLAALAPGSVGKLLLVQIVVALLSAAVVVWFLQTAWFSVVSEAITHTPVRGAIRSGVLEWPSETPVRLAENHFLSVVVDLNHSGAVRSPAHLQVEFGRNDIQIISLAGYARFPYPRDWVILFNRKGLEPWWGAWRPALLGLAAATVIGGLMVCWALMASLYCLPAWLAGLMAHRQVTLGGSWRLAGVALLPGALVMAASLLAYGLGALDPIQLAAAAAAHILLGWIVLLACIFTLPRRPPAASNPFAPHSAPGPDWDI